MSSKIQKEIEKAVGTKQSKKEDRDEYLERLVDDSLDETEGLSDDEFKELSKPAKKWLNSGTTALDKNKPVTDFPDLEDAGEEESAPKKKAGAKKGKKKAAPVEEEEVEEEVEKPAKKKAAKKPAAKKESGKKKPSAISRMQFFCCKHPKMDKEKIGVKVRKEGYEFSDATLSIQYGATHKIMNILNELADD